MVPVQMDITAVRNTVLQIRKHLSSRSPRLDRAHRDIIRAETTVLLHQRIAKTRSIALDHAHRVITRVGITAFPTKNEL
jgi:hypothetical protein